MMTHDYANIIPILHEGLYITPNNQNLLYNLGVAYYKIGIYNQSNKVLIQYFNKNPHDLTAAYIIGMSNFYIGSYDKSIQYLNLANKNSIFQGIYPF